MQQKRPSKILSTSNLNQGGLTVRTGLRGGVCVDVNDQVQSALQTLVSALGGTTTAATTTVDSSTATTA
jgi:hypothetical protein